MKGRQEIIYYQCDCCKKRDVEHSGIELKEEMTNVHICADCLANGWGILCRDDLKGKISVGEYARLSDVISIRFDENQNDFDYSTIKSIWHYKRKGY